MDMGGQLSGVERCPHCSIARPFLSAIWRSNGILPRGDGEMGRAWAVYICSNCGSLVTAMGHPGDPRQEPLVDTLFPKVRSAHEDLPPIAKRYLQQAFDTLSAPDAAAVMAGSAVDAMLKELGYKKGSVYARIDEALADNKLTSGMADWAHEVRLGSNRPRHSDENSPHISPDEARQSVDFAEALGQFLFVLTAQIERGTAEAKAASEAVADE